jgi:hypothetical protein
MSTWHKKITQSLADSVSAVLSDMKEDQKASQNSMLKKGKGEPVAQSKAKQALPEEDDENGNGNGNGKKLDPVNKKAVKKKFDDRQDKDIDNDGDTDASDKFLHKKRKAITKAIRNTSKSGKKVKLSGKKEKIDVNPADVKEEVEIVENTFSDDRAKLREALEASFGTIFQYSNKEEETYRDQWMGQFDSLVSAKEPNAYLDPLQRRVLYIEGLTPEQAASRYLSHCTANASLAGGEYVKAGTRGGDKYASAQHQGNEIGRVHHPRHHVKH